MNQFGHFYLHCFIVFAVLTVFISAQFRVKTLQAIQAEILFVGMLTISTSKQSAQTINRCVMPVVTISYKE